MKVKLRMHVDEATRIVEDEKMRRETLYERHLIAKHSEKKLRRVGYLGLFMLVIGFIPALMLENHLAVVAEAGFDAWDKITYGSTMVVCAIFMVIGGCLIKRWGDMKSEFYLWESEYSEQVKADKDSINFELY